LSALLSACLLALAPPFFRPPALAAGIDATPLKTLTFASEPKDIAVSSDGEWIFVLTASGEVAVFTSQGKKTDTLTVGPEVDAIETGPRPDVLFLRSARAKTVRVWTVAPIRDIDTAGAPFKGPADAPVDIVVFSEFQCPHCARLSPLLNDVAMAYPETVRLVHKHFPLRRHEMSRPAARAAFAAQQQGKFWEYHRRLYENFENLTPEFLRETGRELDLDMERFEADMNSKAAMGAIQRDVQDAREADVRGVPTVFINGRKLKNRSIDAFQELIEKAMAEQSE
jgi:predicted DsbA family dithiol-disulfide isomerase